MHNLANEKKCEIRDNYVRKTLSKLVLLRISTYCLNLLLSFNCIPVSEREREREREIDKNK